MNNLSNAIWFTKDHEKLIELTAVNTFFLFLAHRPKKETVSDYYKLLIERVKDPRSIQILNDGYNNYMNNGSES